jgi:hypothetical protein
MSKARPRNSQYFNGLVDKISKELKMKKSQPKQNRKVIYIKKVI